MRCAGARVRWADRIVMLIATHPPIQRHFSTTLSSSLTKTADDHDEAAEAATVTIVMGNMGWVPGDCCAVQTGSESMTDVPTVHVKLRSGRWRSLEGPQSSAAQGGKQTDSNANTFN